MCIHLCLLCLHKFVHIIIHRLGNRKNYAFEAVNLQMQIKYLFSERMVEQLTWGRFINTHGLAGHNISSDLYMEHLNRYMFTHTHHYFHMCMLSFYVYMLYIYIY